MLRRMNEAGVLGEFVRAFGRIVAMMQFNMYHHYTVDEHLLRCIGVLNEIEQGGSRDVALASELMRTIQPRASHGALRRAVSARHRQGTRRGSFDRRRAHRPAALSAAGVQCRRDRARRLAGRGAPRHVDGRAIARSLRPQDDRELRRRGAVAGAHEAAHHPDHRRYPRGRPRRVERLEGAAPAHALLRDRAGADRRLLRGQPRRARRRRQGRVPRRRSGIGRPTSSTPMSRATIRPTGSRSICRTSSRMRASCARAEAAGKRLATSVGFDAGARRHRAHGVRARPSVAAFDHRRRLRARRRQHRRRPDLHHDRRARARHHRRLARIRTRRG